MFHTTCHKADGRAEADTVIALYFARIEVFAMALISTISIGKLFASLVDMWDD